MMENLRLGLEIAFQIPNLLAALAGVIGGVIVGAVPGLTATMAVALLVPITFVLGPVTGLIMLSGIYAGAIYGGSISAVLIGIPGTPASIVTTWDGHAMTKRGEGARALSTAVWASFYGGMLSAVVLMFLSPPLARAALSFGPAEYAALAVFSLTVVVSLAGKSLAKGVASALVGALLATVGQDPLYGAARFTFGWPSLTGGFNVVAVLIGLFSIPQALWLASEARRGGALGSIAPAVGGSKFSLRDAREHLVNILRSSAIGVVIGILPGIGPETAPFISYNEARRFSRRPERFGTGIVDGVIASEAANNGTTGGSLVPLLTLGIPGSAVAAVYVGALTIHGLQPGPLLFVKHPDLVYGLFWGFLICNVLMLLVGNLGLPAFVRVLSLPKSVIAALVVVFSLVGTFAVQNNMFDVWVMLASGALGYAMSRLDYPPGPLILGFILGPLLEENGLRALMVSQSGWAVFVQRPISLVLLGLSVLSVAWAVRRKGGASPAAPAPAHADFGE